MGDWMTVTVTGSISPADAAAARALVEIGEDWSRFHCLAYVGVSLCGLGRWIPEAGGAITAVGNLSERDYSVQDVADTLRQLAAVAPSLELKIHCGGPYESKACVATVAVHAGEVTISPPEIRAVGAGIEAQADRRFIDILLGGRS